VFFGLALIIGFHFAYAFILPMLTENEIEDLMRGRIPVTCIPSYKSSPRRGSSIWFYLAANPMNCLLFQLRVS
jgi:hypothetical protein